MKHYLLTGEPWIPVIMQDGSARTVSLLTLFRQGKEITDLSLPPGPRIAVMRLLLCIAARALPLPQDRQEWQACESQIGPQCIAYLEKWQSAFDLYGEKPFLQAVGIEIRGTATLDKLDYTRASGGNHTLFDHGACPQGRECTPAQQVIKLLMIQNFAAGGTVGPNSWNGIKTNDLTGNIASPALEGSPLHVFLLGSDILETLHLNLIPCSELGPVQVGIPVWENPPQNVREAQQFRNTLLGRLAPISRAVLLPEEGAAVSLAVACNYAQIREMPDPYLANIRHPKDQQLSYLRLQPDRHPWRELEGLLALHPENRSVFPPKQLNALNFAAPDRQLSFWCGGVAVDKAKYEFTGEWQFSFTAEERCNDRFWTEFGHFAQSAEDVERLMRDYISRFWKTLSEITHSSGDPGCEARGGREAANHQATLDFWQHLDRCVTEFLAEGSSDCSRLYVKLKPAAEKCFMKTIPLSSPRCLMALGKIQQEFERKLNGIVNKNNREAVTNE